MLVNESGLTSLSATTTDAGIYEGYGIFVGETIAYAAGLQAASNLHLSAVNAFVDNQPLYHITQKGIARNNHVNEILRNTPTSIATTHWVPTHVQAADPLTRGGSVEDVLQRLTLHKLSGVLRSSKQL
jgi:hypothetical protein